MIGDCARELQYAARRLVRTPAWTAGVTLTIALGIGSSASVEGFVRGLTGTQLAAAASRPETADGMAALARLLWIAATAIFVIASANVASFLLARAAARARETALRVAIGAGRHQLVRQVLADSVVLSILGAVMGGVFAMWIGRIVPAVLFDQDADQMVFAATLPDVMRTAAMCAAITIACGMLPLIEMRHDDPGAIMQRETAGPSRHAVHFGRGLVIVQMAACTLLVVSTGLLLAGFRSALQTSAGRRLSEPIVISVDALQMSSESQEAASGRDYFAAVAAGARQIAGVSSLTWMANVPGNRPTWRRFHVETANLPRRAVDLQPVPFTPSTVESIILPPVAGRLFSANDTGDCSGVVLSREAAQVVGGNRVVGRSIELPDGRWVQVLGVVRSAGELKTPRIFQYQRDVAADRGAGTTATTNTTRDWATYGVVQLPEREPIDLDVNIVSADYFEFMGLPLLDGRAFSDRGTACRVGIVNQAAADRYFGGAAVGGAIVDGAGRRAVIIGTVGANTLRVMQRDVEPTVYFPSDQDFVPRMTMIGETNGVGRGVLDRLHGRIASRPGGREDRIIVTTLDRHLSRTAFAPERIGTVLIGSAAAIALLLGALALHGVMSDAARRRQREFAIRMALGARGAHVMKEVIAVGIRQVLLGTAAGTVAALMVGRWLSQVAPVSGALSPLVWLLAPACLAIAVLMAGVVPARRLLVSDLPQIMRAE